jgi:NAD(P)-dependent dehydrogenase (short-subunit alcohol dehydrogenase family)
MTPPAPAGPPPFPGLEGSIALVTGASRGIGRALCTHLARAGAQVAVNYRSQAANAASLVKAVRANGGQAEAFQGDVTDPGQARELVGAVSECFGGPVGVLVNNVGDFSLSAVADTSTQRWREVIASNLDSAFYVTKAALPEMRRQRRGRIVMIGLSPTLSVRAAPNLAAYAVAKTGVAVLARTLAVEEAEYGITVNCLAPGLIDNGHLPVEQASWMAKRVPAGRLGTGEDIAEAVLFLVSDRASYISGATLAVSGGWDWQARSTEYDGEVTELFEEDGDDPSA